MQSYIFRRLLLMIPTIFLVTLVVFATIRAIPGSALELMAAEMQEESGLGDELTVEYLKQELGMDSPFHIQYGRWLWSSFQGDLGRSLWTHRIVTDDLARRVPVSAELGILTILTSLLIAIPVGMYSAVRQDTWGDYVARTFAILCISLPSFWLGTMVIVYPSIWFGWSPRVEYIEFFENPGANLLQFIIPSVILGMVISGTTMRMTRTMMLEVLRQDYIKTAWSKGLRERVVIFKHALKNAMIPVITVVGLQLPVVIGGSVVLEKIFALPGVGLLLIEAITKRDYPIISGINLVLASFILLVNLGIDILYAYLDPRIRYK